MRPMEFVSITIFSVIILSVYIRELFLILRFFMAKLRKKSGPAGLFTKPALLVHLLALIGIFCFLYGYFIEPRWLEVRTVDIFTDKLSHTNLRIVQISDLHCDTKLMAEDTMIETINSLKPDIIVFTGDSANSPESVPVFKDTMRRLKADIGKYAVTGNFDYWLLRGYDLFGDTGFEPADRKNIRLEKNGETFFISGLNFNRANRWYELLSRVPAGYYSVFLYHTPDLIETIRGVNVDLYLAGHTHGGQIALPFYGAIITLSRYGKKYESGKYVVNGITLYVNRGIGMEGKAFLRVRFFARPEITVFNIMPKK